MLRAFEDGTVELYYDNSKKLNTKSDGVQVTGEVKATHLNITGSSSIGGNVQYADNVKAKFGASNDLQIYHDGSNSYIAEGGTGQLRISGSAGVHIMKHDHTETMASFYHDGAVELYHNNAKKFETVSGGATVTGNLTASNVLLSSSTSVLRWPQNAGSNTSRTWDIIGEQGGYGFLEVKYASAYNGSADEKSIRFNANDAVYLYFDNAKKFETRSGGCHVNGNLEFDDSNYLMLGNSNDLQLFHNGTNSAIKNLTGRLDVYANTFHISNLANSEDMARFNNNGDVQLYYDYSKKFETTSTGVNLRGTLQLCEGHFRPYNNNTWDLGTSSDRWRNVYTNDLHLSNEGHSNDIDGTWGNWTIQEGESDLFLKNNRSGKKYKFNLTEVS